MSERSKGDTSSPLAAPPASARVVKNPLLSASVTGLTFDDFQNKPLLLPAAPPILHPAPVVSSRESTPLVTVGKSSDIDSENLSEINLNDFSGTSSSSVANTSDENSNTLLEPSVPADNSILSQAASSFSQLPSVASSVFSTFSKKFNSSSGRDDVNANPTPQLNIQPFATQFLNQPPSAIPPPPSGFENPEDEESESSQTEPKLPVTPPTFYSPTDIPSVPSGISCPPIPSGQNTYRISAKKKIYAPIPGLSSTQQEQNLPTVSAAFLPPIGFESSPVPVYSEQPPNKPEERKGGLFSLSNLVPAVPNVFQNLSGLVQSAAGSLSQKTQEPPQPQAIDSFGSFNIETHGPGSSAVYPSTNQVNFFGDSSGQQTEGHQSLPPVNLFGPPVAGIAQVPQPALPVNPFALNVNPPAPFQAQPIANLFSGFPQHPAPVNFSSEASSQQPVPAAQESEQPTLSGVSFAGPLPPKSTTPETKPTSEQIAFHQPSGQPPPVKPPTGGPPSTSFRLQKGTRLYKSPFVAGTSEYQHPVSGYPPVPQSIIPLSQTTAEVFSHFNPFQQEAVPPQGSVPSLFPGRDSVSASILVPLTTAESIVGNSAQEGRVTPVQTLNVFHPIEVAPQGNTFPNIFANKPITVPFERTDQSPQPTSVETERKDTELQQLPAEIASTTNPINVSETDSHDKKEVVNVAQDLIQEQLQLGQSILLPPPPAVGSGIEVPSKETANFPPPPPQHSFQNKPSSNPYRKGLQAHHSPLPAPTSLSAIFTPSDQDLDLFKPSATEPVIPLRKSTSPVAAFFTQAPETDVLGHSAKVASPSATPETAEVTEDLTALILSSPTDSTRIRELSSANLPNKSSGKDSPPPEASSVATISDTSERFTPITATAPPLPPADELTLSAQSAPVSSFFTKAAETAAKVEAIINPVKDKAEENRPTPSSSFVNFFKTDSPPSDSSPLNSSQKSESPPANAKPSQSEAPVPAEGVKIASPIKSQDNTEPQQLVPNLFSSFFEPEPSAAVTPAVNQQSLPDPTSFFDSFAQVPSVGVDAPPTEDPNSQRIQNFFNNPPPKDLDPVGDLNYNLVGSGLSVKQLQTRSLTPASNLAEPPSSSCSDFSELNSSLSAANKQPRPAAEDSTKVSPEEEIAFEAPDIHGLSEEVLNELKMASSALETSNASFPLTVVYKPAVKHWFYKRKLDAKQVWTPFSYYDSALLEDALALGDNAPNLVAVEGGRYDVNISERVKVPIYWEGDPIEVKRCSWFYKASDSKYVPYEEEIADLLEEEYRKAAETGEWHKKIPISAGDMVVFHGPTVIVLFQQQQQVDSWGGSTQTTTRPRVVKRDLDDFTIEEGESHRVDHLLFMVHGIGSACDLKMRSVEEVVDEFRSIALQLVQSHYKNSVENGFVGRVEVLPVSWHSELHSDELGIDEKLKSITLESIPKLRNFTNDTLLDILFYTSPMFCQRIMNTVTASMNSVFVKYKERNPDFHGGVSLAGHSLGSLILFDLLCHQRPFKECEEQNMENPDEIAPCFPVDSNQLNEEAAKHISYKMGPAGTGQPFISYPQLFFQPKKFFALGSPIGMFVTIRGIDKLGLDFRLPTCPGFYNIFHPYDPVAYRLEALVNPDMNGIPPVLIPHHKGRKRMHLELKETMTRVGADLKQRFFDTFKTTFDSVSFLAPKAKNDPKEMEKEVDKVLELQVHNEQQTQQGASTSRSRADSNSTNQSDTDIIEIDFPLGKLNDSKRVDYVLQEAPLEFFNEYLFALSSHVCYWESEDTILFVMKEIYSGIGFSPDSQVPQQTMTIERPSSSGSTILTQPSMS